MMGRLVDAPLTSRCQRIPLGRVDERRGSLCVAEVRRHLSFAIQRIYWIFDVPIGSERANHAHREQSELLIALRGAFTVECDDGHVETTHRLDSPDEGLLLPPMVFHRLYDFAAGSVCLVLDPARTTRASTSMPTASSAS